MSFGWAAALTEFGVAQMLLSVGMIVAGGMSIAACGQLFHTSWAAITGGCLFFLGAVNTCGCKCTRRRMLLGLAVFNFLMITAAVAAIASGGIGVRCELNGREHRRYDDESCHWFADVVNCTNDRWKGADATPNSLLSANITSDEAFESHYTKGLIINSVVLGTGVILLFLCIAAAIAAVRASEPRPASHDIVVVPTPHIIVHSAPDDSVQVGSVREMNRQVLEEKEHHRSTAISSVNVEKTKIVQAVVEEDEMMLDEHKGDGAIEDLSATSSSRTTQTTIRERLTYSPDSRRSSDCSCSSGSSTSATTHSSPSSSFLQKR